MSWRSSEAARQYHQRTKHSPASIRSVPHFLDWDNQPIAFKIYRDAAKLPLPAVSDSHASPGPSAETFSHLLFYSAGITKHLRLAGGGEMPFRAAACTGALYHIELYLVTSAVPGLETGVYHYDPREHALDRLRAGDWRAAVVDATGGERAASDAAAFLVLTTTYWRNAWKYRARAYRHAFWDGGTLLSNFLAMGASLEVPSHLVLGFADDAIHRLIDVDPEKESAVAVVALSGASESTTPALERSPPPLRLATVPLSSAEVDYPDIRAMQKASTLATGPEARDWREAGPPLTTRHSGFDTTMRHLDRSSTVAADAPELEGVIRKRGSARRFERTAIDYGALSTILAASTQGVSGDALPAQTTLCDPYVIVNAVDGLPSGAYAFHPRARGLELLEQGDFRGRSRFLDLEQDLAGDAAANLYLLVDLKSVLERYGNRGYRVAQLEGGIIGGRVYLASYARGLAATGLTFYDDAVTELFSPHAAGKSVMFLVAFGVPARRPVLF
ncbi:MAG: SagB/ThcOx family dehydrogenase, partial [Vicinamibacteria bacterium]